ncbi:MAG: pilus assembly protein CpaF [Microbacterium sp. SCN 70-27]|uniref:TadA family conjugal transfer-associated ATPase n=1 Tax=unclassified Microbacterium TaxID=2609290 RepID=UPI00086DDFDE|nr:MULTISPECIES: TadA family conjugal transfer-associated ATPase [unclassified Microbacterium]MBN9224224.1 TadA family conjugal transfer-associated ATPase [Microbacterium sp.]ODT27531.1 MAG: pilus assembly protein CpaF [Microbacterium sp. SCN 70-27]
MSEPFIVRPRVPEAARRRDRGVADASLPARSLPAGISVASASAPAPVRPARRALPDHPALEPLRGVLSDPAVTDVFVNGTDGLFVDRGQGAVPVQGWTAGADELRALAVALIGIGGRHLDDGTPLVDVRWEEGARVHAVLPPVACSGAAISIRLPSTELPDLDDLGRRGMFDAVTSARLDALVAARTNLLVTGATGAGKTTLLAALLGRVPVGERIVTIEDVAELRLEHPHHVRLEARQPNLEGVGAVSLARLVREALRMRPDRLVVGECRGEEVRELLTALNTGHAGGAGTVHVGSIRDLPARLEALGALAGLDDRATARQVVSAIGAVIHVERGRDGLRRVAGLARPVLAEDRLTMEALP